MKSIKIICKYVPDLHSNIQELVEYLPFEVLNILLKPFELHSFKWSSRFMPYKSKDSLHYHNLENNSPEFRPGQIFVSTNIQLFWKGLLFGRYADVEVYISIFAWKLRLYHCNTVLVVKSFQNFEIYGTFQYEVVL